MSPTNEKYMVSKKKSIKEFFVENTNFETKSNIEEFRKNIKKAEMETKTLLLHAR